MNLTALRTRSDSVDRYKVPWWTRGDLNAFFGLAFNILVNVLTLTSLLIFVVHLPAADVLVPSDCVGSYFPEFQRIGLEMVAAQGGIFGWVSDSSRLITQLRQLAPSAV